MHELVQGRILIIADELKWLDFASSVLSEAGYVVTTIQNLEDGWELLKDEQFELALIDLNKVKQEASAFQEAARLQAERGHRVAVMFPTELKTEVVATVFKLGAHDCIDKKYDEPGLLASVQGQLDWKPAAVLIVEDDKDWRKRLAYYLRTEPYQLELAEDHSSAQKMLTERAFDVVVLDLRLVEEGEDFEGMTLLHQMRKKGHEIAVIIVSAYGTVEHVRDAFKNLNICDYIAKQHFSPDEYRQAVQKAVRQRRGET
jgi:DNA-binding NtrC family response regulator